jgi:hypothetical protein
MDDEDCGLVAPVFTCGSERLRVPLCDYSSEEDQHDKGYRADRE